MTEGERDGLSDLGDDVHRRHYHDRLGEALEPRLEAEILYVVVPYHSGGDERPGESDREVLRRGLEDLCHTEESTDDRAQEERADIRGKLQVVLTHRVLHKTVEHRDELLEHYLHLAGTLRELPCQDRRQNDKQQRYRKDGYGRLSYRVAELEERNTLRQLLESRDAENYSRARGRYESTVITAVGDLTAEGKHEKAEPRDYQEDDEDNRQPG